jgi:hypothetical protein
MKTQIRIIERRGCSLLVYANGAKQFIHETALLRFIENIHVSGISRMIPEAQAKFSRLLTIRIIRKSGKTLKLEIDGIIKFVHENSFGSLIETFQVPTYQASLELLQERVGA